MSALSAVSRRMINRENVEAMGPIDATSPETAIAAANAASPMDSNRIAQADWNRFRSQNVPLIERLSANDTSIVDQAEKSVGNIAQRSNEQIAQVNGRRLSRLTPAQLRLVQQNVNASSAGTAASTVSNAAIQQRDINDSSRVQAYGFANALGNQGVSLMSNAEAMKANRDAQNKANSKGFMSSALGLVGTVGGFMVGGPVGASIGGAIGTGIGGSI